MVPCKFQTAYDGDDVLVYSEDHLKVFVMITKKEDVDTIIRALDIPRKGGKVYALAEISNRGVLVLGDKMPEQDW